MQVKLLSGALGAEIDGINLKDISAKNFKVINNLLLEHKVLFLRNQHITSEEQIALAKCFGPLERHVYVKGRDKYPEIVRITKGANEKHQWGETWHTDVSYNVKPTKVIVLKSIKIPPVGGDTMFSNMELACDTLDKNIKDKIKDKKALHSSLGAAAFLDNYKKMKGNGNIDEYSNEHPILRIHPETGKKILFVNSMYVTKNY
jgi:taurine dioxygenase